MPLFLQPQVQMKCAECSKEEEEEKKENPPVQKKCAHCEEEERRQKQDGKPAVQTKCAACEAAGLEAKSTTGAAREGVANANRPLPHMDRIQAAFGRHDISSARASVGGEAAEASGSMGALAYTSGDRVAFRSEPDVNLAAHEAAHVVQQRSGAKLPGGVGRPGDVYEQQADAAASAVERGESAEPILDRGISADFGGDSTPAVQHRLEVNASRTFEPPPGMSDTSLGGADLGKSGKGSGKPAARAKSDAKADDKEKDDPADAKDGSSKKSGAAPGPQPAGASASASPQTGASPAGQPAVTGTQPAPAAATATGGSAPANSTAPQPSATAAAATPAAGATTSVGEAPPASGGSCAAECYKGKKEEPPKDKKTDDKPANPPAGDSEEHTSDGDEPDLPEPDDCSTQQAQAGAPADAQGSAAAGGGAPAPANAPAGSGVTPAAATPEGPAQPSGTQPAAAKGKGPAGTKRGGGGGGRAAGSAKSEAMSPMDGAISQTEGQRASAVASYENSSKSLEVASANSNDLRAGVQFANSSSGGSAQEAQREAAASRAEQFFGRAADGLGEAIFFASSEAPDQIGAQAESGKAQIAASAEAQKQVVSARIASGRAEARGDAAIARRAVLQQSESFIEQVHSSSATAIAALTSAHAATMGQVDAFETQTLDQVNQIYADGRVQMEGLGNTVGDECTAIGEHYATTYEGFEHCTENGFWDGDLSERRSYAQAKAARKTAKGYHDRMVEAAKKRAREVVRNGRKSNRCQVITTAGNTRKQLDETLTQLTSTIESSRDHAIEQANSTRTSLLGAIDNALSGTLRQLDQQEHDQRQMIDDTCYLQQVVQEQMAHTAASSLQTVVGNASGALHDSLFTLRARFASTEAPDPKALDQVLSTVSQNVDAALDGMQQGLASGTTSSVEQLSTSLDAGLKALDDLVASNDETATALLNGFGAGMGAIAGQDNFASQRAGFAQLVQQATTGGTDAFHQIFDGMREGCGKTLEDSRKSLKQASVDLEKSLRQSKQGIECQITKEADEAASHEAPAWKMLIAILLIIIVIVIIIAVTILTAGAGLGLLAVMAIGAVVGAVTSGLITMATNLWSNQDVMEGVGEAMIMGAVTGALGGAIGMGVGAVVGKVAGTAISVAAKEIISLILSTAIIDVGTQLYQGKGSLKNFSFKQLGMDLAIALVMHKAMSGLHAPGPVVEGAHPGAPTVEPPTVEPSARPSAPEPTPVEPLPTEAIAEPPAEGAAKAPTPEEKAVLDSTANKDGESLSPKEINSEKAIAANSEPKPINDPPFTTERELPNGHKIKETADGKLCERCSPGCGRYNEKGELIAETEPTPTDDAPAPPGEATGETTPKEPGQPEPKPTEPTTPEATPEPAPAEPPGEQPTTPEEEPTPPAPEEDGQNRRRDPGGRRARGTASKRGIRLRKRIAYRRMSNGEYDPLQDVLTPDETAEFLDSKGKTLPKDIDWHHTRQSSADPGMADVPEHIQPLRLREHMYGEHLGSPGNVPTAGIKGDVTSPTKPIFDPNAPEVQTGRYSPNEPSGEPTLADEGHSEGDFSKRKSPNFRDLPRVQDPALQGQFDYQERTAAGVYRREIATGDWIFFPN